MATPFSSRISSAQGQLPSSESDHVLSEISLFGQTASNSISQWVCLCSWSWPAPSTVTLD